MSVEKADFGLSRIERRPLNLLRYALGQFHENYRNELCIECLGVGSIIPLQILLILFLDPLHSLTTACVPLPIRR